MMYLLPIDVWLYAYGEGVDVTVRTDTSKEADEIYGVIKNYIENRENNDEQTKE